MDQAGCWRKGPWTPQEDKLLLHYVSVNGEGRWSSVSKCTGLKRSGKSCRLRWVNYLRPGLKKGHLTPQEEGIIIELHALWGNRWSTIARYLPGRTDNEIKNYWRTHFKARMKPSSRVKQEKTSQILQQQQFESNDHDHYHASNSNSSESDHSKKEEEDQTAFAFDNHHMLTAVYQESSASDDSIPLDCYLWGGLWNLDGDHHLPNDQEQANATNYYHPFAFGGDAFDCEFLL